MRKKPPCMNCPDRELNCHGSCEKYKGWRAELNEINRVRAEEQNKKLLSYSERAAKGAIKKLKEGKRK